MSKITGRRYTEHGDTLALRLEEFSNSDYSAMACAVFIQPEDRVCDVAEMLDRNHAAVIATEEKESLTKWISRSEKYTDALFCAQFTVSMGRSAFEPDRRLAWFLNALPAKVIVFTDAHLLPKKQLRVLNRALSILAKEPARKRVILFIQGKPEDFDPVLQSHDCCWETVTCPRMNNQDVRLYFSQRAIAIDNETTVSKLRHFAHSAPQRLSLLRERAVKMGISLLTLKAALILIKAMDSEGLKRPMDSPVAFVGIKSSKARSKRANRKNTEDPETD